MKMAERRIILIGKTGNGKSSTGNSIIGRNEFATGMSTNAVTEKCELQESNNPNGIKYVVCDTPGLFDVNSKLNERLDEIQKSLTLMHKNPHAFILVFSSAVRITVDEATVIWVLEVMFGKELFDHCIVVVTRGDDFNCDDEFRRFWSNSNTLKNLIRTCGDRVVRIDNRSKLNITDLLTVVETLSENGDKVYTCQYIDIHSDAIQKYLQTKISSQMNMSDEVMKILEDIRKQRSRKEEERQRHEKRKKYMKIAVGAVSIIGGATYCVKRVNAVHEVGKAAVIEVCKSAIFGVCKSAVNKVGKAAVKEDGKSAVTELGKAAVNEVSKAGVKDVRTTVVKEVDKTAVIEVGKVAVNEVGKAAVNEVSKAAVKEVGKAAVKEVGTTVVKEVCKTAVKEVGNDTVKEVGTTVLKKVGEIAVKEVGKSAVKEVEATVVKEVCQAVVKKVDKTVIEEIDDVNSDEIDDVNGDEIYDVNSVEIDDVNGDEIDDVNSDEIDDVNSYEIDDVNSGGRDEVDGN